MDKMSFNWADPFDLESQLTEEERMVQKTAHAYAQDKLAPRVLKAFRDEKADPSIFREMGELGFLGADDLAGIRRAGLGYVAYGLIAREVERVDSGYRSMMSRAILAGHGPDRGVRLARRRRRSICRSSRRANGSAASA